MNHYEVEVTFKVKVESEGAASAITDVCESVRQVMRDKLSDPNVTEVRARLITRTQEAK